MLGAADFRLAKRRCAWLGAELAVLRRQAEHAVTGCERQFAEAQDEVGDKLRGLEWRLEALGVEHERRAQKNTAGVAGIEEELYLHAQRDQKTQEAMATLTGRLEALELGLETLREQQQQHEKATQPGTGPREHSGTQLDSPADNRWAAFQSGATTAAEQKFMEKVQILERHLQELLDSQKEDHRPQSDQHEERRRFVEMQEATAEKLSILERRLAELVDAQQKPHEEEGGTIARADFQQEERQMSIETQEALAARVTALEQQRPASSNADGHAKPRGGSKPCGWEEEEEEEPTSKELLDLGRKSEKGGCLPGFPPAVARAQSKAKRALADAWGQARRGVGLRRSSSFDAKDGARPGVWKPAAQQQQQQHCGRNMHFAGA